ncbi:MAG: hypothetical protein HY322_06805 [Betaproteobacteria bacterium]|nr:hypothetical protein [Betaproteobacteria bacterium]
MRLALPMLLYVWLLTAQGQELATLPTSGMNDDFRSDSRHQEANMVFSAARPTRSKRS